MKNRILLMSIFLCVFASIAFGQNMTVKDSEANTLMEVEDMGTTGALSVSAVNTDSIEINSMGAAPDKTSNKLYNVGGSLYWSGSSVATGSGLTLPYSGSTSSGSDAFAVTTTGTGKSGYFLINNVSNSSDALYAQTNGDGRAVYGYTTGTSRAGQFQISNASNSNDALYVSTNGTGRAGFFSSTNASNSSSALYVGTVGSGFGLEVVTSGTNRAGDFEIANNGNASAALYAATNGTSFAGHFQINNNTNSSSALYVQTNGLGNALKVNHVGSSGNIAAFYKGGASKMTINGDGDGWFAGDGNFDGMVDVGTFLNLTQQTGAQTPDGSNSITVTTSHVQLGAAEFGDELDTINGGSYAGQILILIGPSTNDLNVLGDDGNILLNSIAGDFHMDWDDTMMLIYNGSNWLEICRSSN